MEKWVCLDILFPTINSVRGVALFHFCFIAAGSWFTFAKVLEERPTTETHFYHRKSRSLKVNSDPKPSTRRLLRRHLLGSRASSFYCSLDSSNKTWLLLVRLEQLDTRSPSLSLMFVSAFQRVESCSDMTMGSGTHDWKSGKEEASRELRCSRPVANEWGIERPCFWLI